MGKGRTLAVDRNHAALMRLLAVLLTYVGIADDTRHAARMMAGGEVLPRARKLLAEVETLPRRAIRLVLALLGPVEDATRRLIVMVAAGMPKPAALPPLETCDCRDDADPAEHRASATDTNQDPPTERLPLFAIVDPAPRFDPRGWDASLPVQQLNPSVFTYDPERASDPLPCAPCLRRVAALAQALGDLRAQAERYLAWQAQQFRRRAAGLPGRDSPLKPGLPRSTPRLPKSKLRDEHHVLAETHSYAWYALRYPDDTS